MIKLERILCPTELSEDSERTLRYAVALARSYGARLFVCHRPKSQVNKDEFSRTIHTLVIAGQTFASAITDEAVAIDWESVLLDDPDLGSAITREAELRQADLIFMRSRRRPLAAALLGSTAETVSRLAPCPVLVMHADEREWLDDSTGALTLGRILVAYDFSPHSELALQYALTLAQQYQAELHLLHVMTAQITGQPEVAWIGHDANTPYHLAARRLQAAVPAEVYLWSSVKHSVQYGHPHNEVLTYAEGQQIDLIAMGAHGLGFGMHTILGSNVDKVLRQARCPVLIAHPLAQAEDKVADI